MHSNRFPFKTKKPKRTPSVDRGHGLSTPNPVWGCSAACLWKGKTERARAGEKRISCGYPHRSFSSWISDPLLIGKGKPTASLAIFSGTTILRHPNQLGSGQHIAGLELISLSKTRTLLVRPQVLGIYHEHRSVLQNIPAKTRVLGIWRLRG